jgi:hypothetical protein
VDGSLRPPTASAPGKGGGAVAFLTAETSPHSAAVLTGHIATCTYCGEQTVANSEYAGYALALQTLGTSPSQAPSGWAGTTLFLNALDLMHAELQGTAADPPSNCLVP